VYHHHVGLLARLASRWRRQAGLCFFCCYFFNVAPLIRQRVDGSQCGLDNKYYGYKFRELLSSNS